MKKTRMYVPIITNLDNVFKIGPRNNIFKFKIGKKICRTPKAGQENIYS